MLSKRAKNTFYTKNKSLKFGSLTCALRSASLVLCWLLANRQKNTAIIMLIVQKIGNPIVMHALSLLFRLYYYVQFAGFDSLSICNATALISSNQNTCHYKVGRAPVVHLISQYFCLIEVIINYLWPVYEWNVAARRFQANCLYILQKSTDISFSLQHRTIRLQMYCCVCHSIDSCFKPCKCKSLPGDNQELYSKLQPKWLSFSQRDGASRNTCISEHHARHYSTRLDVHNTKPDWK